MIDRLRDLLTPHGLVVRGALHPDGEEMGTLVLIGNLGPALWAAFSSNRRDEPDPLDDWTRRVIEPMAAAVGARALYPFEGPPWHPFLAWAQEAEGLKPSPIGPLIHPVFGPWHAYRAALVFTERLALPPPRTAVHPCDGCDRPCLGACPVSALSPGRYEVPACAAEVRGQDRAGCRSLGCAARRACPVGAEHRYPAEELAFHMAAFLKNT